MRFSQSVTYSSNLSEISSSGASPRLYEKPWENPSHKGIHIPFGSSKSLHSIYPTTQRTESSGNYFWQDFQSQIVNLGHAEANVRLWEPKLSRPVDGTAQIIEDVRSPLFYSHVTSLSDVDVVVANANVCLWEPKLSRPVGGTAQIIEDVRSPLFYSHVTSLSDVDVVVANAETGTAITDFTQLRKYQVGKQKLEISERFNVIAQREDNWDGYESKKPTELTLDHAKRLMDELFNTVFITHPWLTPFISSNEDGYITAEWYEEERELHIQIREDEAEYLQVWGINIHTEMHEDFLSREDYLRLWEWLLHGQK